MDIGAGKKLCRAAGDSAWQGEIKDSLLGASDNGQKRSESR